MEKTEVPTIRAQHNSPRHPQSLNQRPLTQGPKYVRICEALVYQRPGNTGDAIMHRVHMFEVWDGWCHM
eukprot:scaffold65284_cov20-Tisochrysis_lutea.AAC.7